MEVFTAGSRREVPVKTLVIREGNNYLSSLQ
jgi:hypothetical protein